MGKGNAEDQAVPEEGGGGAQPHIPVKGLKQTDQNN